MTLPDPPTDEIAARLTTIYKADPDPLHPLPAHATPGKPPGSHLVMLIEGPGLTAREASAFTGYDEKTVRNRMKALRNDARVGLVLSKKKLVAGISEAIALEWKAEKEREVSPGMPSLPAREAVQVNPVESRVVAGTLLGAARNRTRVRPVQTRESIGNHAELIQAKDQVIETLKERVDEQGNVISDQRETIEKLWERVKKLEAERDATHEPPQPPETKRERSVWQKIGDAFGGRKE